MNDPFILLPANLAGLARLVGPTARYALGGVKLCVRGDTYEAVATDGRRMALVEGTASADPLAYPDVAELADLPPSQAEAVIPAADWKEAFAAAARGLEARAHPERGCVAVHLGEATTLLVTTDGETTQVVRAGNEPGRYPPYRAVLPSAPPLASVDVDPRMLLGLLEQVLRLQGDEARVTLELRGPGTPVVLRAAAPGQTFTGVVMPLA